jgi:DNA-binding CsgD family transcriptional regulator
MNFKDFTSANRTDVGWGVTGTAAVLFAAIALLIGLDVLADYRAGTDVGHLLTEGLVMALALAGAAVLWRQLGAARRRAETLTVDLAAARREADRFRDEARDALRGLGEAIDSQFTRWGLTAAEREVGLLLLKGLSHKEVAAARATSETTIRQQALAIYRKSGLRNRSDLSAFFLEDLLLPPGQRGSA